ncbi:MAG TPA: hypothetical protein VNN62_05665 [Methylomirabilota bacterium]|nr:hypothetical protein [Methylomirabilota bacterium]
MLKKWTQAALVSVFCTPPKTWWVAPLLLVLGAVVHPTRVDAQQPKPLATESVSKAHTLFAQQCELCHEKYQGVPDKRCLTCHDEPAHNKVQAFTPPCRSCHQEHQGKDSLAQVANEQCVTCHVDLPAKENSAVRFTKKVTDFAQDHPEFAFTTAEATNPERVRLDTSGALEKDHTTITFPHNKHLGQCPDTGKPCLKGPKGLVKLECKNCHALAADGVSMKPVTYAAGCQQECHPLHFEPQSNRVVPHSPPREIRAFLFLTFSERREAPPPAPLPERAGRLTRPVPSVSPINPAPGVTERVAEAEKYLYQDNTVCDKCHLMNKKRGALPEIVAPAIPTVWFPHARFAHKPHRLLECTACHPNVTKSGAAKDVLIPAIHVCRECHRATPEEMAQRRPTAATECIACHQYHPKTEPRDWNGPFTIQRVLTEGVPAKKAVTPREGQP